MDEHHNWWGIGYMLFTVAVGISLLLILIWRERPSTREGVMDVPCVVLVAVMVAVCLAPLAWAITR